MHLTGSDVPQSACIYNGVEHRTLVAVLPEVVWHRISLVSIVVSHWPITLNQLQIVKGSQSAALLTAMYVLYHPWFANI